MKILQIDVNCKNSSTGKIAYSLHTQAIKEGYESAICYGRGPVVNEPNILKFGYDWETRIHALMTRLTGLTGCFSFFSTRKLLKFMDEYKPDVVHIHELHAYFVNIKPVVNYLKQKKIKTVWTFHCEFMYTGKCGHAYECEKWKTECGHCPHLLDYPKSWLFDFTRKMFKDKKMLFNGFNDLTIVTPSNWLANRVRQSFLKDKKIGVIHNGIDTNVFHQRSFEHLKHKHSIKDDEKVVLAVAPNLMDERKGGKYVLQLAEIMKNENVRFIMIGIDDLNQEFPKNVIPLGRTNNQVELAEYYSMADVFVICSSRENYPTTCLEAVACGTPVVGFDTGGTRETAPGEWGVFVKYGDTNSLKNVLLDYLNNKTIDIDNSNQYYSENRMVIEYQKLYI